MIPEFKVGDKLEASDYVKEELGIEYVTITSINEENKVYHWEAELKWEIGGTVSSGYYFHEAKPYTTTAREYNSPIIQELMDEITPEEMQATEVRMLRELIHNQHDLDPEFGKIISDNFDDLI